MSKFKNDLDISLITNQLYNKYNYIFKDKKELENILYNLLPNKNNNKKIDKEYLGKILDEYVLKLILEDNDLNIINNFIDTRIVKSNNYKQILKEFNKISNFFIELNNLLTVELCINILRKNSTINDFISVIVNKNIDDVKNNNILEISDDYILGLFIESYCIINGIEINEPDVDNLENIDQSDYIGSSLKMYFGEINKKLLTKEEEQNLFYQYRNGNISAKDEIIMRNLKLVISIARRYQNKGMELIDLIQEGNIGLMTAVEKFDYEKGYKFSTYATWWIRQAIIRSIADKSKTIRLPVHLFEKFLKITTVANKLQFELNRTPTIEEIANEVGMSVNAINEIFSSEKAVVSMNQIIGEDDQELEYFIPSSNTNIEQEVIGNVLKEEMIELLEKINLSEKEREIIKLRYGFYNNTPRTLEEIGAIFNVTRERIRQLETRALKKLRNSKYIKEFAIYMDEKQDCINKIDLYREKSLNKDNKYLYSKKITDTKLPISNKKDLEKTQQPKKRKRERIMKPRYNSIYEYFFEYSKEEIDNVFNIIDEKHKARIIMKYGDDLCTTKKLTQMENQKFYESMSVMKRALLKNRRILKQNKALPTIEPKINKNYNKISKESKQMLMTPTFTELIKELSYKDVVIVTLKFGFIDEKAYDISTIANFLDIDEQEVIDVTKKVITTYKERLTKTVDEAINSIENSKVLKKDLNKKI